MIAFEIGFHEVAAVARRDPHLPIGLLLFGLSSVGSFEMLRMVHADGHRSFVSLSYVTEYARRRKQRGWPSWPLHLFWLCLATGMPLTILRVSRL
jgi:hypothetical protein